MGEIRDGVFEQEMAYGVLRSLVGSEVSIRDGMRVCLCQVAHLGCRDDIDDGPANARVLRLGGVILACVRAHSRPISVNDHVGFFGRVIRLC